MRLSRPRPATLALLAATALPACKNEGPKSNHGYVRLQFRRVQASEDPFQGTRTIDVKLKYDTCLTDFYTNNPNWAFEGIDGAEVVQEFRDPESSLNPCNQKDSTRATIDCQLASVSQDLSADRINMVAEVADPNDIEDAVLFVGPVPCAELTGCDPIVTLSSASVSGKNNNGGVVWSMQSFSNPNNIACEPGAPMEVLAQKQ